MIYTNNTTAKFVNIENTSMKKSKYNTVSCMYIHKTIYKLFKQVIIEKKTLNKQWLNTMLIDSQQ